jgi:hypothetical protein
MRIQRAVRFLVFGLLLLIIPAALSSPSAAQIGIGISVRVGPPALPVYEQPLCPGPGYLWTPGYWAWSDDDGYYWVPGTWVVAPVGLLWTPGYWGWNDGFYAWHAGYWGPHIGFYGGINYGFGYGGVGFVGGEWRGGTFFYNTAVMRVDSVRVTNVYVNRTVIVRNESHVAFNGGEGGVAARPTAVEERYARETHQPAVAAQTEHERAASQNRTLFASENHGRPAVAATARPGQFSGRGVVTAKAAGAPYHAPAISPREARSTSAGENRPSTPRESNSARDSYAAPAKSNHASTNPMYQENKTSGNNPLYERQERSAQQPKSSPRGEPRAEAAPRAQKQERPSKPSPPKEEKHKER